MTTDTTQAIAEALHALDANAPAFDLRKLKGDASTRAYYRLTLEQPLAIGAASLIAMRLPEDAFQSDEGGQGAAAKRLPFCEVADLLHRHSIRVPRIFHEDLPRRVLLLEDLGDETFEARLLSAGTQCWPELYGDAVDLLATIHTRCAKLPTESIVAQRSFDRTLLEWELDHFREWGLEALHGELSSEERDELDADFSTLVNAIDAIPRGFVHRDYQSRNLMWLNNELVVIDFQDALFGPYIYDLVALLCDSYVALEPPLQRVMIARYADACGLDLQTTLEDFWRVAVHRKLKDAGRFVYIDRVRGNPDFLRWYPQSLRYVGRALAEMSSAPDMSVVRQRIPGFPDSVPAPPATSTE